MSDDFRTLCTELWALVVIEAITRLPQRVPWEMKSVDLEGPSRAITNKGFLFLIYLMGETPCPWCCQTIIDSNEICIRPRFFFLFLEYGLH
jgi:hypothetical protein